MDSSPMANSYFLQTEWSPGKLTRWRRVEAVRNILGAVTLVGAVWVLSPRGRAARRCAYRARA